MVHVLLTSGNVNFSSQIPEFSLLYWNPARLQTRCYIQLFSMCVCRELNVVNAASQKHIEQQPCWNMTTV